MKRIVILGAGESGAGAAVLAKKEGFEVFVSDMSKIAAKYQKQLNDHNIEWEEGQHTEEKILNAYEIIKSPGIPDTAPIVKKAIDKGIHIISEIEFAGRYTHSKMICITGSNGKTTTTSLIYHIFKDAGYDVGLAGNIGNSNTISSSSVLSSSTTCMTSVPISPSCSTSLLTISTDMALRCRTT